VPSFGPYSQETASAPSRPIPSGESAALSGQDYRKVIFEWNRTEAEFPQEKCIHELFEAQAAATPELVALEHQGKSVTYQRLNRRANQLARYLRQYGVGPEVKVGICLERSLDMITGLLAVLKAGGAYVPMDHLYPHERLTYMMQDSSLKILLTQEVIFRQLPSSAVRAIFLEKEHDIIEKENGDNLPSTALPLNLAYAIYTSGSTGQPKGVEIPHYAVVNFLTSMRAILPIQSTDTLLAQTTLSFDIAGLEIYLPLITGARVRIADRVISRDSTSMAGELAGVTMMQATPTGWSMLLESGWKGTPGLKILCGGEELTPELARNLSNQTGDVWNLYGPTETTIWSLSEKVIPMSEKVTIGRPIANTQVYILDEQMQPVQAGAAGELWIGGAGLARGYANQPRTTAERFMPDPFSGAKGARIYRTGDLARWGVDGKVEYSGRADHQVKIRGYRIELGEIETRLRRHPRVQDAVVVARDQRREKQLVGYVIPAKGHAEAASAGEEADKEVLLRQELQDYLRSVLPQFMVPSAVVVLASWPLTLNGKVDRTQLPAPDFTSAARGSTAPRTRVEEKAAAIWRDVLGLENIDVHANFFHLGGQSLMAARISSEVRELFGVRLSVERVLENPTIAQLSSAIESALGMLEAAKVSQPRYETRELPLEPVTGKELPLSYSQQRMWLSAQLHPGSAAWNVFIPLRWFGPFSFHAAQQSLAEIVHRHSALRCTFHLSGGRPIQRVHPYTHFTISEVDLSGLDKEHRRAEAMRVAPLEGSRPFNFEKDLLVRAVRVRLSANEQILLVTSHHIASDLVSVGIFGTELGRIYQAICTGQPTAQPELKLQYSDFAYWQRQWLAGNTLDYQRVYWKKQLESAPRTLLLQPDHPRNTKHNLNGKYYPFVLPPELYSALVKLGGDESATLYMTVLATFKAFLYRLSGQPDLIVGTDVANRTQPHTDELIGFFVNLIALRTRVSPQMTFRQLLRAVRQTALDGYAHQDLPFEEVLKMTGRDELSNRLFQVAFIFQHETGKFASIPDVKLTKLAFDNDVSMRDASLYLWAYNGGLHLSWNYRTELFELSTVQRWTNSLLTLIQNVVRNPDIELVKINLTAESVAPERSSAQLTHAKFQAVRPKAVNVTSTGKS
jgi:amino acid adenylation domain-containing protein